MDKIKKLSSIKVKDFKVLGIKIKGFTLVELLIVIGILSILTSMVVIVLNPDQLIKQSRDSKRFVDLQILNKAFSMNQSVGGVTLATSGVIYVSIPSSSSTCAGENLPVIPGWTYHCVDLAHYRNIDGTGWIPVDFTQVQSSLGALFASLPIDPVNTTVNGLYYTYVVGSWALSAGIESEKYQAQANADGGYSPNRYEVGNDMSLNATWIGYAYY